MKIFIAATFIISSFFIHQVAQAKESSTLYLSAKAGFSLMEFDNTSVYTAVGGDLSYQYDPSADEKVYGGGLGIGYYFSNNFRAEIEYFNRSSFEYNKLTNDGVGVAKWDIKIQTLMAQVFYDFNNSSSLTPYVIAGVGAAFHSTELYSEVIIGPSWIYQGNNDSTEFAWEIGFGTSYEISEHIDLDFMYRYISLGETELRANEINGNDQGVAFTDMKANEILFSARYSF